MTDFETIIAANYSQRESDDAELSAYQAFAGDRVSLPVAIAAASAAFPRFIAAVDLYRVQH